MDNNLQNGNLENTTVVDNALETNEYEYIMERNKKENLKLVALMLMVTAILLICSGCGYLFYLNSNPVKVYQTAITNVVDDVFDGLYQDYNKTNTTVKLSTKVNVTEGLFDQEILDYINKTTIMYNTQFDGTKQQMIVKIDSDYDNKSLIDLALFLNAKDEKTYLYAKDYYDKYLEIEMEKEVYDTFRSLFEELDMTNSKKFNAKKAKNIIKKEVIKLITKDECTKKDGEFVFEITDKQFANKIKMLLTNLKNNESFLKCFEESDSIKMTLESIINTYQGSQSIDDVSSEKLTITMNKGFFSTNFDKLTLELGADKVLLENKDEKMTYEIYSDATKVIGGYIKNTKVKNTEKLEISVNIPEVGTATVYVDTTVLKNSKIETVDSSNAVKLEELSEDEMMDIMTKIEESPLYELISSMGFNEEEDYEDDYWEDDDFNDDNGTYNGILMYDTSVKMKDEFSMLVPSIFEDDSNTYEYSYEYVSGEGVFDTCSVSLISPYGYTPSDNLINQLHEYNAATQDITTTTINGIRWQWFSYEDVFGKTYYYITDKDNKVYLLEYEIEKDADSKCETYKQQILNSITEK